jgi:hypothetical protein
VKRWREERESVMELHRVAAKRSAPQKRVVVAEVG